MIAYFKCLCKSSDKLLAKRLRGEGVEVRVTKNNPDWAKEAKSYGLRLPIIVEGGGARQLWT